jgi:type 1 glutamine amidotransferase
VDNAAGGGDNRSVLNALRAAPTSGAGTLAAATVPFLILRSCTMKWRTASIVLVCLVTAAVVPVRGAETSGKVRVLLTYGGHGFEEKPFFAMFDALPDVTYTKAVMPKDAGLLEPGLRTRCDVLVMYDMSAPIAPEQKKAFVALLHEGIGVVSLHHNLGAHRDWDEFTKIIGGRFVFGKATLEGKEYKESTWAHDQQLKIAVADKTHPITKGLRDFEIHDETYGGYYTASDVHVLLTTDHPQNGPKVAWTKTYGQSRVFHTMLGHDHLAWENPNYPKLLHQAILWAAGR